MKRNSTITLTAAWWRDQEPKGLSQGKDLAKALGEYEITAQALRKTGSEAALASCLKALQAIDALGAKILSEATKLAKTPPKDPKKPTHDVEEMGWTADAFKKIDKVLTEAKASAQALVKAAATDNSEDDDDSHALADPDAFKTYLKSALMRLRKGPLNMALVVAKDPLQSRALLHRTSTGKSLGARLVKDTGIKRVTWGLAQASEDDPNAIILSLEGPKVSGLKKQGELLLKAFKPQPFSRLVVMIGGQEDLSEEDEHDDTPAADPPTVTPVDSGFSIVTFQKARLVWLAARKAVQDQLRKLEEAILAELKDDPDLPDLAQDIRQLDEVLQALDEQLADRLDEALNASDAKARQRLHQEASALMTRYRDYVTNNAFVGELETNPFTPVAIRSTVLRTLDVMQKNLGTAQQ
jgi:hypothetical protein